MTEAPMVERIDKAKAKWRRQQALVTLLIVLVSLMCLAWGAKRFFNRGWIGGVLRLIEIGGNIFTVLLFLVGLAGLILALDSGAEVIYRRR